MTNRVRKIAAMGLVGFAMGCAALAQVGNKGLTEQEAAARLLDKPLFLRGLWAEDKLKFDGKGQPEGSFHTRSFTLCGLQVTKVKVSGDKMRIEGQRVGLRFAKDGTATRVPLTFGSRRDTGQDVKMEMVTIDVNGHGNKDFGPALDAIFANGVEELAPSLPPMWEKYAKLHWLAESEPEAKPDSQPRKRRDGHQDGAKRVGGSVRPPHVLRQYEPEFSEEARRMKYSGNVQVSLVVDETGTPTRVQVSRPAGMGLDERAVASVQKYAFEPATRNGEPVKVELLVDVNFQIF